MKATEIHTKRTRLRHIVATDLEAIHTLHSIPAVDQYNTLGIPENIETTKYIIAPWIEANQSIVPLNHTFAIEDNTTNELIGLFGLKLWSQKHRRGEVWYIFHPDYWNKGLATEVLIAMLDFGFDELKLHRIQAGCAVDNVGSIRVLEKAGMIREGRGREILPLKSGWSDNFEYSILETDDRKTSSTK